MYALIADNRRHIVSTVLWTIADLADLTRSSLVQMYQTHRGEIALTCDRVAVERYIDGWADDEQATVAELWFKHWFSVQYCELCGVVQTIEQYCDNCVQDIVNYLLWEEASKQEQLAECLHMAVCDEQYHIGKGLY